MQKTRVLVVDDHTIMREGICALLKIATDIEVVGEAANGREALDMAKRLMPDVIVMDISMPVMDGREATRRLTKDLPGIKILVLTQYDDKEHVLSLIEAGACGFVSKKAAFEELSSAVRCIARGESFLSPAVAKVVIDAYQYGAVSRDKSDPYEHLTDREKDVLKLLVEGHTTQEIAAMLVLSPKTVAGYKTSLMSKLDIASGIELVKYALKKGLIDV
jgi:two-component system, NarL family, response regulator LiaR